MLTFGFQIRLMRFFGRRVIAKPARLFVDSDVCAPFVLIPNNTQKPRFIASVWPANILRIAICRNNSQIAQPVVAFTAVDVVDKPVGPDSVRVKPRKPMSFIDFLFNAYGDVAKLVYGSRNIANVHSFGWAGNPSKNASYGVVTQQLTKFFRCDFISHLGSPFWRGNVNAGIIT